MITSEDTLQGISLKYEVTIEELRRVNKLFAGDSIHLRESLLVPLRTAANDNPQVLSEKKVAKEDNCSELAVETNKKSEKIVKSSKNENKPEKKPLEKNLSVDKNLSALNFLQKIDSTISESKKAVNSFCSKKQDGV